MIGYWCNSWHHYYTSNKVIRSKRIRYSINSIIFIEIFKQKTLFTMKTLRLFNIISFTIIRLFFIILWNLFSSFPLWFYIPKSYYHNPCVTNILFCIKYKFMSLQNTKSLPSSSFWCDKTNIQTFHILPSFQNEKHLHIPYIQWTQYRKRSK